MEIGREDELFAKDYFILSSNYTHCSYFLFTFEPPLQEGEFISQL